MENLDRAAGEVTPFPGRSAARRSSRRGALQSRGRNEAPRSSCAGLTRASIISRSLSKRMDCRVKPGNDASICSGPGSAKQRFAKSYALHRARETELILPR
jgi:hypothetical protein